jgi:hypothetical protein
MLREEELPSADSENLKIISAGALDGAQLTD